MTASEVPFVTIADPSPRPGRRAGRHLRPVERPPRVRRRRSPAVPVLVGAGIVIVALFALAAMHALLISGQRRLDEARREVAAETEEVRRLQLQVAELEAPDRILEAARARLGMVAPGEVGYLLPAGVTTAQTEPIRVDAAVPPPPPTVPETVDGSGEGESDAGEDGEPTDETASPEQEEVNTALTGGEEPTVGDAPPADETTPSEGGPATAGGDE